MSTFIPARRRAIAAGVLAVTATVAMTACSSSGSKSGPTSTGSGPKLTGSTITIGYAASESGPQAVNGIGGKGVTHAWQEYVNAHGGILGHPVNITLVDTKNTVPGATAAVKGFMGDKSVDAILMTDLVAEGALNATFANTDIAVLSGGGSADTFWSHVPGVFQDVSGSDYTIKAYAKAAKAAGATKFGWAACAEVAVCAQNGPKAVAYGTTIGMGAAGVQLISGSASDYTAQCLSFINKGANGIALNLAYDTGARLMTDCIQQGYKGVWSTANSGFDQATFGKVAGAKTSGETQGFPWWANAPAVQTYRDAMSKYSPGTAYTSGNDTSIWSTLELLKKALTDAKPATIDRSTVMAAMYGVKNETLGGLLPQPITYTKGQPSPLVGCSWLFNFNAGDKNPTSIPPAKSGNGATGDLASTCIGY